MACLGMTGMAVTVAIWLRVVHWLTVAWVWWPRSPLWAFLSLGFLSIVCSCLPGFVSPELRVSRPSCLLATWCRTADPRSMPFGGLMACWAGSVGGVIWSSG